MKLEKTTFNHIWTAPSLFACFDSFIVFLLLIVAPECLLFHIHVRHGFLSCMERAYYKAFLSPGLNLVQCIISSNRTQATKAVKAKRLLSNQQADDHYLEMSDEIIAWNIW